MSGKQHDDELDAMQAVLAALQSLDEGQRVRVLRWAWERFGIDGHLDVAGSKEPAREGESTGFDDPAHVIEATGASTGPERALSVAFYVQQIEGKPGFSGQEVNTVLKNLGHPLANVTKTMNSLRNQRPALVMQVSKTGRSQQARKTYRLTAAGLDRVRQMIAARATSGDFA